MSKRDKNSNKGNNFKKIAEEWFAANSPQWKQSSIVKYSNILKLYLLPVFSSLPVTEISRNDVVDFSSKLLAEGGRSGKPLSPKTVISILSVLKNIMEYAKRIKGMEVADISAISIRQVQKPMRIFSKSEQIKLNRYLYENLKLTNLGILVCLYTGLRIGEICALKWEDVSFDEQFIYVRQTLQRLQTFDGGKQKTVIVISRPKSDCSVRRVPVPDELFELLKINYKTKDAFLLTGLPDGYIEPRTLQYHFGRVLQKCGIENANFHALRHTFATRCVELGFDVKSLSEILGHANVNITLNRYVHPSMELKQKNMNMLSELLSIK